MNPTPRNISATAATRKSAIRYPGTLKGTKEISELGYDETQSRPFRDPTSTVAN